MLETQEYVTAEDGVRLFVQRVGDGPDTVIIPNRVYMQDAFIQLAARRTLLFCDPRNRGRSDAVNDLAKVEQGIHHDVDDFDAIRRHYGIARVSLLGHSYMGLVVALYAMKYPGHAARIVQIGPVGPEFLRQYPAPLSNADRTLSEVLAQLGELQKNRQSFEPVAFCKKFWATLRPLYVVDPADADRLAWEPCDVPNETTFMKPWTEHVLPSIQRLQLTADDFARARCPVLVIHGRKDRSSAYGGGRDWALKLPNARLVTIDNAAHVPWIEASNLVFGAIETFLDGGWPDTGEKVMSLEGPAEAGHDV